MQFMATITFDPERHTEIERLLPAEQVRVRELQQQGRLETLWVPDGAGPPSNLWVVFNGESEAAVREAVKSLPLYPHMRVDLTPLRRLEARG